MGNEDGLRWTEVLSLRVLYRQHNSCTIFPQYFYTSVGSSTNIVLPGFRLIPENTMLSVSEAKFLERNQR